jgi:hypothetical protein
MQVFAGGTEIRQTAGPPIAVLSNSPECDPRRRVCGSILPLSALFGRRIKE